MCSTSLAYTGSKAVAPPKSTANRSSEIAPSTVRRSHTKRIPCSRSVGLKAFAGTAARNGLIAEMSTRMSTNSPSVIWYTTTGPSRYSRPPSDGPAMTPICSSIEFIATAFWNASGGTRFGVMAWEVGIQNARPTPERAIATNTGQTRCAPESVNHSRSTTDAVETE